MLRDFAHRAAGALVTLAAGLPLLAQDLAPATTRTWPDTLRRLVVDAPAELQGEAALALGLLGDPIDLEAIAAVARAHDERAAIPATIGLGHLAAPGVEVVLGELFDAGDDLRRCAAAYALGLLPDGHPAPRLEKFLLGVPGGSYQRNHAVLASWLGGLLGSRDPGHRGIVRHLADDPANREADLRELAFRVLSRIDGEPDPEDVDRLLESDDPRLRLTGIELAPRHLTSEEDGRLERIARRDRDPRVRAAALDRLTQQRSFAALEIAAEAVDRNASEEIAAGVRAILGFGGHQLRRALERRVVAERSSTRQVAMLGAWRGPASAEFCDDLLRTATDGRTPSALRRAAVTVVASQGDPRALPVLRRELEHEQDVERIAALMHDIERLGAAVELEPDDELVGSEFPLRLAAFTSYAPRRAERTIVATIESGKLTSSELAACLRARRTALADPAPGEVLAAVPEGLRESVLRSPQKAEVSRAR